MVTVAPKLDVTAGHQMEHPLGIGQAVAVLSKALISPKNTKPIADVALAHPDHRPAIDCIKVPHDLTQAIRQMFAAVAQDSDPRGTMRPLAGGGAQGCRPFRPSLSSARSALF